MNFDFLSLPYWFKPRKFQRIFRGGGGATHILASTTIMFDRFQLTGKCQTLICHTVVEQKFSAVSLH